jgi:hypothetical protein
VARRIRRHSTVLVYVTMATAVCLIMLAYTHHISSKLSHVDILACRTNTVVRLNQNLVLQILHRNVIYFMAISDPVERAYFSHTLRLVEQAQQRLARSPRCKFH